MSQPLTPELTAEARRARQQSKVFGEHFYGKFSKIFKGHGPSQGQVKDQHGLFRLMTYRDRTYNRRKPNIFLRCLSRDEEGSI